MEVRMEREGGEKERRSRREAGRRQRAREERGPGAEVEGGGRSDGRSNWRKSMEVNEGTN